jgi:hypothetical protein
MATFASTYLPTVSPCGYHILSVVPLQAAIRTFRFLVSPHDLCHISGASFTTSDFPITPIYIRIF